MDKFSRQIWKIQTGKFPDLVKLLSIEFVSDLENMQFIMHCEKKYPLLG